MGLSAYPELHYERFKLNAISHLEEGADGCLNGKVF